MEHGNRIVVGLEELWTFKANAWSNALAFSDNGYLGVASADNCAYILDLNGNLVSKECRKYGKYYVSFMNDASYCCDKFGFTNNDSNVYIYYLKKGN